MKTTRRDVPDVGDEALRHALRLVKKQEATIRRLEEKVRLLSAASGEANYKPQTVAAFRSAAYNAATKQGYPRAKFEAAFKAALEELGEGLMNDETTLTPFGVWSLEYGIEKNLKRSGARLN